MHIHLPKPLHGWRAFVGEVGIIVLGVLIALAAESAVEHLNWSHKVAVVRRSLMGELANDRARWEFDLTAARCTFPEIAALDAWSKADGNGDPPPFLAIRPQNFFWMHSTNWNLATGSQTLDHFPIDQQLAFAALYGGVADRQMDLQRARGAVARVRTLVTLADSAESRRELRAALGDLKGEMEVLVANGAYMRRHFDALGVKPDRKDIAADLASINRTAGQDCVRAQLSPPAKGAQ